MKKTLFLIIFTGFIMAGGKIEFDKYFIDQTMRVDYHHTGDKETELITIDRIYQYGLWSGSRNNLIDVFNNGKYFVKVYDAESNTLIYSRGFDSYFGEYQLGEDGSNGIKKAFHESALIPAPKRPVRFVLEKRDDRQNLIQIFSLIIDPQDWKIVKDTFKDDDIVVIKSHYQGNPQEKLDIALIGEGYTKKDLPKFKKDIERFTRVLFKYEPYKSLKNNINVYGVLKPSQDSGVDEPEANIFKNTAVGCTFNSMGSERYLLTEDNKALRDIAAAVPYDAVCVMVNHSRYGGGGIYNFYCTFTSDNQFHEYLLIHEFGHSFAGLADEYYTSATAYDQMFKPDLEPLEPNITALLDKNNLKWKNLISENMAIPTEWEKEEFDKSDYEWQKERTMLNKNIARLKKEKAPQTEIDKAIKEYDMKDKAHADKNDVYLKKCTHYGKVGAFEGAGYLPKGMYRPMLDCIMFSKGGKPFCKVCEEAIKNRVLFYSK